MTIRMGRKAWRDRFEVERALAKAFNGKHNSATKCFGEQVMVDLSLPDHAIRRDKQTAGSNRDGR